MSFDWNQVRAFLATAEEGSFSSAARALKTTQPTIGRQITALEETLGVTLLERTVRGPTLTQSGRELLDHVRTMGEAATLISLVAAGQSQDVKGDVALTASDLMSAEILPAILTELRQTAPGIRVQIIAANDIQNLTRREADIATWFCPVYVPVSQLIMRSFVRMPRGFCRLAMNDAAVDYKTR